MCQAPIGKVIEIEKGRIVVDYKGKRKELESKFLALSKGDYVLFSGNIAIDKVDGEEAKMLGMK